MNKLSRKEYHNLLVVQKAYDQQAYLYRQREHSIRGKIVSVSQPHVRPIARGKARTSYEFGAKISAAVTEHDIDRLSWEPYNKGGDLQMQVERYKDRCGHYPESVHVDKIYRTRENRNWCEDRNIRLSGPPLGRPPSTVGIDKKILRAKRKQDRKDESIRQAIEGAFGVGKHRKVYISYCLTTAVEFFRRPYILELEISDCITIGRLSKITIDSKSDGQHSLRTLPIG